MVRSKAMSPLTAIHSASREVVAWQKDIAEAIRDPRALCEALDLPTELAEAATRRSRDFATLVPRPFLARMRRGDPNDPLLLQTLPRAAEADEAPGFTRDPLGEADACGDSGLLRKYAGRILIVTTGACAVHCRFCFRRYFPYQKQQSDPALEVIKAAASAAAEPSVEEIILSGGDPLMLDDDQLSRIFDEAERIPHLRRLRIHTRLPIMVPRRITPQLLDILRTTRLTASFVVHTNHSAEIDADVAEALGKLIDAGTPVLSQSVLLRGVNDDADSLTDLYRRLIDLRVIPYYLHQLDPVAGAAHFETPVERGQEIIRQLRSRLPGYAVPRYVRETKAGDCKEILA